MLPDFERADAIGEFWASPEMRTFGELLIDLEEDKAARAVVFGVAGGDVAAVDRPGSARGGGLGKAAAAGIGGVLQGGGRGPGRGRRSGHSRPRIPLSTERPLSDDS
jgi:hypothetical protein